jgi:hypothetical protein
MENNQDNDNEKWKQIKENFSIIIKINSKSEREFKLSELANQFDLSLENCRYIFDLYQRENSTDSKRTIQSWWDSAWKVLISLGATAGGIGIIVSAFTFISQAPERRQSAINQAWGTIISREQNETSGGRIEALEYLNENKINLSGLKATNAFLSEIKLPLANIQESDFNGSRLFKADFRGANLFRATFGKVSENRSADLFEADLSCYNSGWFHSEPKCTNLKDANFVGADLRNANFSGANLQGTIFTNSDIEGANFNEVTSLTIEQLLCAKNWRSVKNQDEIIKEGTKTLKLKTNEDRLNNKKITERRDKCSKSEKIIPSEAVKQPKK